MAHVTAAPVERTLALDGGGSEKLRDVGRRIELVDNDVHEARDLEAESYSQATETTVAGLARRLERLEQSNEALRRENAILRGQRPPDPPRPPRHRGPSGEATGDTF